MLPATRSKINLIPLAVLLICGLLFTPAIKATPTPSATSASFNPWVFWNSYSQFRLSPTHAQQITYKSLITTLKQLNESYPGIVSLEEIGKSVKGKTLYLVKIGKGDIPVLIWSGQHGDEPKCTAALLDFINFMCSAAKTPISKTILENTTLIIFPMVNPDGAEKDTRRNTQGLDINRDAQLLQSPEGRILKRLYLKYHPKFCFNLHDHGPRRTVETTRKVVALSLQASLFDEYDNDNPARIRAKKVIGRIYEAVSPFAYGHIARYEADYMPRAFGDSMMHWGVSSILIESGGWLGGPDDDAMVVKLHCLALLAAVHAIASGSYEDANPGLYDTLPGFGKNMVDLAIRGATIVDGSGISPFKGDVGINITAKYRPGTDKPSYRATIEDVGDLSIIEAKQTIHADGYILTPGFINVVPSVSWSDLQTTPAMLSYLGAGFTTLVCQGPPPERKASRKKSDALADTVLPLNLCYFDFVPSLQALQEQNFFHRYSGVFVAPRPVAWQTLLSLLGTAQDTTGADRAVNADAASSDMNIWLAFKNRGSKARNMLHLIAEPPAQQHRSSRPEDDAELRDFIQCVLEDSSRITMAFDPLKNKQAHSLARAEQLFFNIQRSKAGAAFLPQMVERLSHDQPGLTLPQVVQKLTSLPAKSSGPGKKGLIRVGYGADLALFPIVNATNAGSADRILPGRLHTLIVNGVVVLENGITTGKYPGKIMSGD